MRSPLRVRGLDGKTYPSSSDAHREVLAIALTELRNGENVATVATAFKVSERTVRRWRTQWCLQDDDEETN